MNLVGIPITKPQLTKVDAEAASRAIMSGWITQGPEVLGFEKEFAAYTGAKHAVAVSSCTSALHLALLAAGVGPGDEVITVSHSFVATANAVRYCGAVPIFIDIDRNTFNMNPEQIEAALTPRTKSILCVHQIGMPCDLSRILEIAHHHNVPVIEDAACAVGSEIFLDGAWQRIGRPHGDFCCFSFHPRKVITTGDGGMITTNSDRHDHAMRLLRQHGMSISDSVRHQAEKIIFEEYVTIGYNYRLTDIQAAVGREQLKRLDSIVAERRALADRYRLLLRMIDNLVVPTDSNWTRSNWQSFCVMLPVHVDQRKTMQYMLDNAISTRRGIMCSHREPAYSNAQNPFPLPNSEFAQDHGILLPLFPGMTPDDQERVANCLNEAIARC